MLRVHALRKTYPGPRRRLILRRGPSVRVLDGVDFEVRAGEVVGLLGANGAGKTTILQIIAGLIQPDSGSAEFEGKPRIGICSSADRTFYYRLSLIENLQFFGKLYGLRGRTLSARIGELLDTLELQPYAHRRYDRCSTGTRQRASLARALLHDPQILLLDEPTRAIDPLHAQRFRRFVRDEIAVRRNTAVVLATNLLEEAWGTCDRIVLLNAGRGIAVDSPAALQHRLAPNARYRISLEASDESLARRLERLGPVHVFGERDAPVLVVDIAPSAEALQRLLFEIVRQSSKVRAISLDAPSPEHLFGMEVAQ